MSPSAGQVVNFVWDNRDEFEQNLLNGSAATQRKMRAVMEYYAPRVESHMKTTAPWEDQTGNARQGLGARAFEEGSNHGILLFHQVPYGIWLEVKYSGRYAVIIPTIEEMGPEVMQALEGMLSELRF